MTIQIKRTNTILKIVLPVTSENQQQCFYFFFLKSSIIHQPILSLKPQTLLSYEIR